MTFYEDLDLRLQSDGRGFVVHARHGDQAATERLEIEKTVFRDLLHIEGADPEMIRNRGAELFDALIHGSIRDFYQQGRGRSMGDSAAGFRLRLIFDPRDARLRRLIGIPWEILRDRYADGNDIPALDARRPVVRTIETAEPSLVAPPGSLKRVLLALANPGGPDELDVHRERNVVKTALARMGITPQVIEHTNRTALMDKIADTGAQIVHFMGHSDIDHQSGEGVLVLEDAHGGEDRLAGTTFAGFFTGRPAPRLVILTSCLSARQAPGQPFAGIAFSLVAAGLPAVIAMQSKVGDESAIRFTERLYSRISYGDPVEAAVADARRALKSAKQPTLDWAAPVLFVRAGCGGASVVPRARDSADGRKNRRQSIEMTIFNRGPIEAQTNIAAQNNYDRKGSGNA